MSQGIVHEFICKTVHSLTRLVELSVCRKSKESSGASTIEKLALRVVEGGSKYLLLGPLGCKH